MTVDKVTSLSRLYGPIKLNAPKRGSVDYLAFRLLCHVEAACKREGSELPYEAVILREVLNEKWSDGV